MRRVAAMNERIAVFSDTHADLTALGAVSQAIDAAGINRIWNLGDFASGGPDPAGCLGLCRERCEVSLLGNHEGFVLVRVWEKSDARWARAARFAAGQLGAEQSEWLRELRPHAVSRAPSIEIVHASLLDPINGFLRSSADAYMSFQRASAPILLFGHTHRAIGYAASGGTGLPDRIQFTLEDPVELPEGQVALNPGAVCDKVGARWLELEVAGETCVATWHRTSVRGHGGGWAPAATEAPGAVE